jgi:hypothetical protein
MAKNLEIQLTEKEAKLIFRTLQNDAKRQKKITESNPKLYAESGRKASIQINNGLQKKIFALLQENNLI